MSNGTGTAATNATDTLIAERSLQAQSARERVLEFMRSHPTAWRTSALAAKLGIKVNLLRGELVRLEGEGTLVSCTVSAPGRKPQPEYRIAANALSVDPPKFVIGKKKAADLPNPAGLAPARPTRS